MALTVTFNGTTYTIPTMGESDNWGTALNEYLVALSAANVGASGVTSLGNLYSGTDAKAAAISGTVLSLQQASTTYPGVMSAADKTKLDGLVGLSSFTATTSDATPLNVALGAPALTVDEHSVVAVQAVVSAAANGGGKAASWGLVATYRRSTSSAARLTGTRELWAHSSGDVPWTADLAVSTNDVVATVTGEEGLDVEWTVTIQTMVMPVSFIP